MLPLNGNSTSQRYVGHAKSRLTLKNVAVPLQLCVVRPRDGHRAIGIGCPSATWRTISPARHEASIAHANDHAEQLRGRSRLPGSGRAPTSRTPLFGSHAGRFDHALSRSRTRSRSRAMLSQGLLLASTMMECTVDVMPSLFVRFSGSTNRRLRAR